jgi:hypothetical protein
MTSERVPEEGTTPDRPDVTLSYHLLVYIDLLGQSAQLDRIRHLPASDVEKEAARDAIAHSAFSVFEIRKYFNGMVEKLMTVNPAMLENMSPAVRERYLRVRSIKINQVGFSDTFVLSVCLGGNGDQGETMARSSAAIHAMLGAAAVVSLVALSRKIPLRGGIDIGLGVDMLPNEVYGPVLVDVHRLESAVAEYPRTVIGHGLLSYLDVLEQSDPDPNGMAATYARDCRRLICSAPDDGWPMLHLLSPAVFGFNPLLTECRDAAHGWIREQVKMHELGKNEKLFRRYTRLLHYFDQHDRPVAFYAEPPSPKGDGTS